MKKVLAAFAVAMALPMTVMAWEPTGDVNVIVAYKAGSGTDTGARLLATEAQKYIPKTIIIQNLLKFHISKQSMFRITSITEKTYES